MRLVLLVSDLTLETVLWVFPASGVGYGLMHTTMLFGSVLASFESDPGVLYEKSCGNVPLVLVLGRSTTVLPIQVKYLAVVLHIQVKYLGLCLFVPPTQSNLTKVVLCPVRILLCGTVLR